MHQNPLQQLFSNLVIIANKYLQAYYMLADKHNKQVKENLIPTDPLQLNKLFFKFFNNIFSDPDALIKYQMSFFQSQFEVIDRVYKKYYQSEMLSEKFFSSFDKRFKDNFWEEHCLFAWFKEAYYTFTKWVEDVIESMPKNDLTNLEVKRLNFVLKQFLDAISPSNFPTTNPEVLRTFFDTAGENFIRGLDNLLRDIEDSRQALMIKTTDKSKFKIGHNVANTEGKVVYQNDIMQLIHYKPIKQEYYSIPILIVSPFINKYYILDLEPELSFVRWLLEQNYNVFVISWVNPDESLAKANFEDYIKSGPLAAVDYITKVLNFDKINVLGYCIGGTLLSATIAYMKKLNDHRINAASFMTSLIDFADAGDLSLFIDDYFVNEVEKYMQSRGGYLDGHDMALTFNLLRSNDMIWPFYVNNYLLGKEAFPFNLLYWNSDSVRMPMELNLFCLRNMYKDNLLKEPEGISVEDKKININDIDIPCFAVAAKADHIVPWKCAFNSAKLFSGPVTFSLADSGHVAGMINHPNMNKYCYWINNKDFTSYKDSDKWFNDCTQKNGSWWIYYNEWLKNYSGSLIKAKLPEEINPTIIEDAPGSYVMVRC